MSQFGTFEVFWLFVNNFEQLFRTFSAIAYCFNVQVNGSSNLKKAEGVNKSEWIFTLFVIERFDYYNSRNVSKILNKICMKN